MPRNSAYATDHPDIVLASGSRHRASQLDRLGLPFSAHSPDVDETPHLGEPVRELVTRLALAKAQAVMTAHARPDLPARIFIASDQSAAVDVNGEQHRLDKPGTPARAEAQLQRLSGREVAFHTSLVVTREADGGPEAETPPAIVTVDVTRVRFRTLSDEEIRRYVAADDVLDCAGAFRVESLGISLFESIQSVDPTALVGLPMISLCAGLRACGVSIP